MKRLVVAVVAACSAPAKPVVVGNTERAPVSLAAALERDLGAGMPVAIVPGPDLRAISADGARERVLVPGPVPWALVDQRSHAIWFGNRNSSTISVLDLDAIDPQPVTVVADIPTVVAGPLSVRVFYPDPTSDVPVGDELTFGHPQHPQVILRLGPEPSLDVSGGLLEIVGDQEKLDALRAEIRLAKLPDRELLVELARRGAGRTTTPRHAGKQHRVEGVDPAECFDATLCGQAETVTGTKLWRVTIGHSCGDACYLEQRLYDPQTKQFLAADWARRLQDAWVSADGTAFVASGVVIRFASGPLAATPISDELQGGGWLGTSYYYGL